MNNATPHFTCRRRELIGAAPASALIIYQCARATACKCDGLKPVLFSCEATDALVQHLVPNITTATGRAVYECVHCPACSRIHLVNQLTGKTLGDERIAAERAVAVAGNAAAKQ